MLGSPDWSVTALDMNPGPGPSKSEAHTIIVKQQTASPGHLGLHSALGKSSVFKLHHNPRVKVRRSMLGWGEEAWEDKVNKAFGD